MIAKRPFAELGQADHGWLKARFHFSFANYYNPARMSWGALRVWNDDTIMPGGGFDRHGHRDMEIITYVRSGAITHRDHLGNEGRTGAGDVQVMSAGRGILHEEHNFETEPTTLFQIWIEPNETSINPAWQARQFPKSNEANQLIPLASGQKQYRDTALPIHQDATLFGATLTPGAELDYSCAPDRQLYLVTTSGRLKLEVPESSPEIVNLEPRDGAAIKDAAALRLSALRGEGAGDEACECVLADVPMMR